MATPKKANPGSSQWTKGKSGNPGGRSPRVGPNGESLAELARGKTLEMFEVLCELTSAHHEPEMRFKAACAVLDRGHGKPKESVDLDAHVTGNAVPIIQIVRASDAADTAD